MITKTRTEGAKRLHGHLEMGTDNHTHARRNGATNMYLAGIPDFSNNDDYRPQERKERF